MDFIPLNARKSQRNFNESDRIFKPGVDPKLVPRVREYLRTKGGREVDMEEIAVDLQKKFNEYRRKQKRPFLKAVSNAFEQVRKEVEFANRQNSDESDNSSPEFSSDNENYVEMTDKNLGNLSLRKLYGSNKPKNEENKTKNDDDVIIIEDKKRKRKKKLSPIQEPQDLLAKKSKPLESDLVTHSTITFKDMGGCEATLIEVCNLIYHMKHPEIHTKLGVKPSRGILLRGPPGCGKTMLASAIAGELNLPFIKVASTELVSGVSGESEEKIREVFGRAIAHAPSVLFIDEIDAITRKRETAQREMEVRIVSQLLTSMDELNTKDATTQVLVIGATNRPDALDPALRRGGRFDTEINVPIPDESARIRLLKLLCQRLSVDPSLDFNKLARLTPGFVGADLEALSTTAAANAVNRVLKMVQSKQIRSTIEEGKDALQLKLENAMSLLSEEPLLTREELDNLSITLVDFEAGLKTVQPSAKREGFTTVPDVTWEDVGALNEIQAELRLSIAAPIHFPQFCEKIGRESIAGILLYGPPGCGKTLLAKAIANESGLNFISVKGPELVNMYVGESERGVRMCFERASNSAPCVIFFDEFDAICQKRSRDANNDASTRLVNQLLTCMDSIEKRKSVFIIGATNRPDCIDRAVLRPNRLGKLLYIGLPTPQARVEILQTLTKKVPLAIDVDLNAIGLDSRCEGFTGADLHGLVQEAVNCVVSEAFLGNIPDEVLVAQHHFEVAQRHFQVAFTKVRRSVSIQDEEMYERMKSRLEISQVD